MGAFTRAFLRLAGVYLLLAFPVFGQFEDIARQVSQPNYTHYLNELLFTHAGDSRGPNSPQHESAQTNIRDTFAAFGLKTILEPFEYQGRTFYNVAAILPGIVRPGEYHVIGAHYDSANNPGADDDATGVAALLEAARVASTHQFEASLVFVAFDREEAGLIGSKAWAAAHAGDRIMSMVQLDMIGYNPPGSAHNLAAVCVPNTSVNAILPLVQSAIAQYSGGVSPVYGGVQTGSDHASFARFGPAVEVIEASYYANTNYHKAADSVDTPRFIDYGFAAGVTRSIVGFMAQQAGMLPENSFTPRLSAGGVFNSASFIAGSVAPAELVTLMGSGFGTKAAVSVLDSAGNEQTAAASYVSPRQINVAIPATLATGPATMTITREDGLRLTAALNVDLTAPGIFTAASSGLGAAAAQAVMVAPDGRQTVQTLFDCRAPGADCAFQPINFGDENDRVVLILYGTGLRGGSGIAGVAIELDGEKLPAQYAGPQGVYPGLDQVNVELSPSLRGKGALSLTLRVDGKAANPVIVVFGGPEV